MFETLSDEAKIYFVIHMSSLGRPWKTVYRLASAAGLPVARRRAAQAETYKFLRYCLEEQRKAIAAARAQRQRAIKRGRGE
jgi:hypothetical protein